MKLINKLLITVFCISIFCGCGVYSFTGVNISPNIETIYIENFFNDTGQGPANISQLFTEGLKDYFQQNTSLRIVSQDGDLSLSGAIVGYNVAPTAPVASGDQNVPDEAGLMRLTITVKAEYVNIEDDEFDFNRSFSFYADFNPRQTTLTAVENELVDEIFEQIILDIFNASVANW
ncbi:MAG: LPS assembly lipoprotein LptE [Cyclobacteriaceae bacterium]|nr:LptE family protein [Cyclobacteriaceae bacterium]MCH8516109.1 LPS assembly lipoprotein LptE [Cyclobacteriaceae bacterium]